MFLVWHFLIRSGEGMSAIGVDFKRPRSDLIRGAAIAAVIGGSGLALYLGAHAAGINLTVVAEALPGGLVADPGAGAVGAAERRSSKRCWCSATCCIGSSSSAGATTARWRSARSLRGSYHLYQGFGGFLGNAIMGLIFGRLFQRWGRAMPMLIAHTLIDAVAFIGYAELAGHVSWLPAPV